ncbi:MAG: monovalent cation/H(+) antiporter subunit G [Akkermansiaceae bacterium]|nr:monovalent cation/H(+) antiporter subunit G [Akkermansiaceae bacterium]
MIDFFIAFFALAGCLAVLLAAVGIYRFPNFFTRAHAATKASAFGLVALMIAACLTFPGVATVIKSLLAMFALFLTLPVASQALAHAARKGGEQDEGEG